jgi:hypothetical protein
MNVLADNDILKKGSCFRLLDALVGAERASVGVLGESRFVLPKKIRKARLNGSPEDAIAELEAFIADAKIIEPTEEEQRFAAVLELLAQRQGLSFDSGESQLCAVLVTRGVPKLLTGDKRAITALERLLDLESRLEPARGRIQCLEQLVRILIDRIGVDGVRAAVCAEPNVDRALSICFSCGRDTCARESVLEGLASYIRDVRDVSARVLASTP